ELRRRARAFKSRAGMVTAMAPRRPPILLRGRRTQLDDAAEVGLYGFALLFPRRQTARALALYRAQRGIGTVRRFEKSFLVKYRLHAVAVVGSTGAVVFGIRRRAASPEGRLLRSVVKPLASQLSRRASRP